MQCCDDVLGRLAPSLLAQEAQHVGKGYTALKRRLDTSFRQCIDLSIALARRARGDAPELEARVRRGERRHDDLEVWLDDQRLLGQFLGCSLAAQQCRTEWIDPKTNRLLAVRAQVGQAQPAQ